MSISRQEELIGVCWLIAAITAFGNGYVVVGWICLVKSFIDMVCSIVVACKHKAEAMARAKEDC